MNGWQKINSQVNTITIIKAINIIKESNISLMERRIVFQVDFFLFQNRMKGFHGSVIKRTALFTVRKSEAHPLSSRNILRRSILASTVAVKNNIIGIVLILPWICQCRNNKRTIHFSSITVTDDFSCTDIQNASKISPAMLYGVDICNIWKPYLIRFLSGKILIDQIFKFRMFILLIAVILEFSDSYRSDTKLFHKSWNTIYT